MRKVLTAVIWILAVGLGLAGSELYKRYVARGGKTNAEYVEERHEDWKKALADLAVNPPPSVAKVAKTAPLWQQKDLRKKLIEVDATSQLQYLQDRKDKFNLSWEEAVKDGSDSPRVASFLPDEKLNKKLREQLQKELTEIDEREHKRHARLRLALDSFSGYCVLRTQKFVKDLKDKLGIKIHLVDDDADYAKRLQALKKGDTPLAVFTVDALIQNSALLDGEPPATIVLVLDETRGADAMFADKTSVPSLAALNRKDLRIVVTEGSPSETLARVVRSKFSLPDLPLNWVVGTKEAKDVVAMFRDSKPGQPKAFVLWEPFVSKLLKENPNAHVLIDSSSFPGYIVDVLVVNRKYLQENRDTVKDIVKIYLQVQQEHQKSIQDMIDLVVADSHKLVKTKKLDAMLTKADAAKVVQGIWWKNTRQNYVHFGLEEAPSKTFFSLAEMIKNINAVLVSVDAIARKVPPNKLYDKSVCEALKEADFDAGPGLPPPKDDPKGIGNLVAQLKVDPIHFARGSAEISDDLSQNYLKDLANVLKDKSRYHLEIRGHALGNTEADRELAEARAQAVKDWLVTQGAISRDRLRARADDGKNGKSGKTGAAVTFFLLEGPP